eukprot:GHVR01124988.1.p1 GENE.GHVR01124988.1~~GHVR01124988.1.p1  ORF type:complete len:223 (+),score=32.53 GHVR01124988.1:382-1050(+)
MGNHEYYAGYMNFYSKYGYSCKCFGGEEEKTTKFSDDSDFYRKYVKSLKVAVVVNKMFFSHAALPPIFSMKICEGLLDEPEEMFPEKCLRAINTDAIHYLPTDEKRDPMAKHIYKNIFGRRVREKQKDKKKKRGNLVYEEEDYCEEHIEFLNRFGTNVMYIGHELLIIEKPVDPVICEWSLVFCDYKLSQWMYGKTQKTHTAVMFHIGSTGERHITVVVQHE